MMPSMKTVTILAPVLGPLAARIMDRMLFDQQQQQQPSPPQIIQVPMPQRCHCCCGGQEETIMEEDEETPTKVCTTCVAKPTTHDGDSKQSAEASAASFRKIRSMSTSEEADEVKPKKAYRLTRSLSDSHCDEQKKAKIDDETLAILARHMSREIIDDGRTNALYPEESISKDASKKLSIRPKLTVIPPKSPNKSKKSGKSYKLSKSATTDFHFSRASKPPDDEMKALSCRLVANDI